MVYAQIEPYVGCFLKLLVNTIRLMDTITYSLDKKLTTNQTDEHWEHWMISLCLCC